MRQCQGCTECCFALSVKEIGKADFTPCPHIFEWGCSLHGIGKPAPCVRFECLWLQGKLPLEAWPAKTHLVCTLQRTVLGTAYVILETEPEAAEELYSQPLIEFMVKQHPVFVRKPDGDSLLKGGSPEQVQKYNEIRDKFREQTGKG